MHKNNNINGGIHGRPFYKNLGRLLLDRDTSRGETTFLRRRAEGEGS